MAPKSRASKAAAPPPKARGKAAAKGKAAAAGGGDASAAAEGASTATNERTLKEASVVVTGEFDGITRDQLTDQLKAAGAKVLSAVSGKTTFLVVGSHLDDGRPVEQTSKYRKYLELKGKGGKFPEVLRENDAMELLGTRGASGAAPAVAPRPVVVQKTFASLAEQVEPWVDRHRPRGLNDLLGNANAVKKLTTWLRDWDDVVFRGRTKPVPFKPGGGLPDNVNARAALISGPPGIGKTTAARLVAKSLGWDNVLEYNASDARSAKIINAMAEGLSDNRTLSFGGSSGSTLSASSATPALAKRCVILMDEVDGMSGGDRGGNAALIKMIKKTKNPIICICNDHGSPKVRSLAFSCYDIRFARPTKTTIAQRAADIAASEGLSVEPNALEALAESCGNDVRHVLHQLQLMSKTPEYQSEGVGYTDMKDTLRSIAKDGSIMLNPFDACRSLLTSSIVQKMATRERFDYFFVDHQLMHLMIQENYLNSVIKKPADDDLLQRCAQSASSIADGDIVGDRIRSKQEWSLLPDMGLLSTVMPSFLTNGFVSFPEFPKFLGNYSKMSRARRLNGELQAILRLSSGVQSRQLASTGTVEVLFTRIINCLEEEDISGAAAILDAYGLQRDHISEHLNELMQHLTGEDAFKSIDPKVKSAMTREMNSGTHALKVFLPQVKRKRVSAPDGDDLGEEGDRDAAPKTEEAEEDGETRKEADEATLGGLVKRAKAKRASKAKAKASSPPTSAAGSAPEPKVKAKAKAKVEARAEPKAKAKAKAETAVQAKAKGKAKAKAETSKAKARGAEPPAKRAKR